MKTFIFLLHRISIKAISNILIELKSRMYPRMFFKHGFFNIQKIGSSLDGPIDG